jgi:multiple sugar transport system ATP-binding protein
MAEVRIEKLVKTYPRDKGGAVTIVKSIDLTIADHEFLVLVGPSGCGKSTTLRMIAGLEEIDGGTISIGSRVVNDVEPKDRDIAMVFQNYALYPHMSVYKNMAFGLELRKLPKAEIDKRVREAAAILGLNDEMLQRKPKALSGGQRQRVAVGRAIVRNPQVFLFDEPLSNLDAKMRVQMRTELVRLHQRLESTMIYVTHDQVEAMTMGDRIAVMKDGHIMQVADPLTLYSRPQNAFVAGFIGSPPMNLLKGKLEARDGGLTFVEAIGDAQKPQAVLRLESEMARHLTAYGGKIVLFGIRPEDITEHDGDACPGATIRAVVDVSEPMGADTMLYVESSNHTLIARATGYRHHVPDEEIQLVLDMKKAHVFDAESEESLTAHLA